MAPWAASALGPEPGLCVFHGWGGGGRDRRAGCTAGWTTLEAGKPREGTG